MDQPFQPGPLESALSGELQRGERVLWQSRANGRFRPALLGIWLFAIPWTAFAVFWTLMAGGLQAISSEGWGWFGWLFPLFGVPFILIGIGMLSVPFAAPRKAKKTLFAVTDQRVIKLYKGRSLKVESVPGTRVGPTERTENTDGSGTIKIAVAIGTDSDGARNTEYFVLGEVPNIRMAESRLRELQQHAARLRTSS